MEPLAFERAVIDAAEGRAALLGGDPNHTVAAAAVDTHGRLHQAVNVYHFTGGPCAELVVLGVAATAGAGPLLAMAAAGDGGRGLIPPCGRCRQAMVDLHPDLLVAVPTSDGPTMKPIASLLPDTYQFPDANTTRVLRFNRRYHAAVMDGTKRSTVRWNEPVRKGPVLCVFEDHPDWPTVRGAITNVARHGLAEMTHENGLLPSGSDPRDFVRALRRHYPTMPDDADVDVVEFTIDSLPEKL